MEARKEEGQVQGEGHESASHGMSRKLRIRKMLE